MINYVQLLALQTEREVHEKLCSTLYPASLVMVFTVLLLFSFDNCSVMQVVLYIILLLYHRYIEISYLVATCGGVSHGEGHGIVCVCVCVCARARARSVQIYRMNRQLRCNACLLYTSRCV